MRQKRESVYEKKRIKFFNVQYYLHERSYTYTYTHIHTCNGHMYPKSTYVSQFDMDFIHVGVEMQYCNCIHRHKRVYSIDVNAEQ